LNPRLLHFYPFLTPRASLLLRLPTVPPGLASFPARHGTIAGYHPGRDHICASLYWFGDFDPWVDRTLRRLVRAGESALDIGANVGATALVLARAAGPSGKVFAFEPHPENAYYLRANLSASRLACVDVQELAVSSAAGRLYLGVPAGQPGMASLGAERRAGSFAVRTVRLDDWLELHPELGPIAACKIDVEGHEPSVFSGMEKALASGRIAAFLFERHAADGTKDPILRLLAEHDYKIYRIEKSPLKVHYVDPRGPSRARPTSDYVAVHWRSDAGFRLGL
jgi:FkbM family methyltransferase